MKLHFEITNGDKGRISERCVLINPIPEITNEADPVVSPLFFKRSTIPTLSVRRFSLAQLSPGKISMKRNWRAPESTRRMLLHLGPLPPYTEGRVQH